ncbi:uncharacterized protein BCR38DRAFT_407082 [Pseudomassariella vexata]|uniref:Uncharacterized protein n=1 Tax=Pseudomassariella vexata TaxID=1141098 RepID=A0A1Y2E6V2_9PEZI|nr:uncharacterized protein BCR38DRAFT_407082 [Pseudomassariella vexata]ORY67064.1 hypothetical protein BCR38DRAFT_407082 [Pseudomassariella vexata]
MVGTAVSRRGYRQNTVNIRFCRKQSLVLKAKGNTGIFWLLTVWGWLVSLSKCLAGLVMHVGLLEMLLAACVSQLCSFATIPAGSHQFIIPHIQCYRIVERLIELKSLFVPGFVWKQGRPISTDFDDSVRASPFPKYRIVGESGCSNDLVTMMKSETEACAMDIVLCLRDLLHWYHSHLKGKSVGH